MSTEVVWYSTSHGYFITDEVSEEDIPKITAVVNAAYWNQQQSFLEDEELSLRTTTAEIYSLTKDKSKKLFVAISEKTEEIVGSILYNPTLGPKSATFGLFAVDPNHQGKKLGDRLIRVVEKEAIQDGKEIITIEILGFAKKLLSYYERLGYQSSGITHSFHEVSRARLKPEFESSEDAIYVVAKKRL